MTFNFGLIRKKEFFQFEALVETQEKGQKAEEVYDDISVSHRIANTQKIKKTSLLTDEQLTKKKKRLKSFGINLGLQFLMLFGIFAAQVFYFKTAPIHYKSTNNQVFEAKATSDMKIKLRDTSSDEELVISVDEFQKLGQYLPFIPNQTIWEKMQALAYVIPLILLLISILVGWDYMQLRKSYKLHDIFSNGEEK